MAERTHLETYLLEIQMSIFNLLEGTMKEEGQKAIGLMLMHTTLVVMQSQLASMRTAIESNEGNWEEVFDSVKRIVDEYEKMYNNGIQSVTESFIKDKNPIFDQLINERFRNN
jgi:uncharacterized protein YqgV (UPF0045/DUF77 family)